MPRREGVDALGLPIIVSASRSRPGSSNAMYPNGGTGFAGSSSSLGNTGIRGPAATSEPNLAALMPQSPGPGHGPVSATEAPHLSTTESFFGRMTLTAPDNMRRKKAEEREKKKQVRKKRAERGAIAAASLANPPEPGPSHQPTAANAVASGLAAAADTPTSAPRRRKRPVLPTSSSGSNLHIYTLEQSRSRSPTRPVRSQSGQSSQNVSRQASPERRQVRRRARGGSDASAVESGAAAAPTYQQSGEPARISTTLDVQPTSQELALLPTAAQQRRDIYADLNTLGLPGADEADLEDQPPPFPLDATRPISPPRMPADGQEWTEEMRRRQEEYEMNRPPDSPPPAFQSDDETRAAREGSEQLTSSDEESNAGEIARERQEWEDDVAAGFSLEERIERDRLRREVKEGRKVDEEAVALLASPIALRVDAEEMPVEEPLPEREEAENEVTTKREVLPNAATIPPHLPDDQQSESQAEIVSSVEQQQVPGAPSVPLNLGQLVMEARARRASEARKAEELIRRSEASRHFLQGPARFSVKDVTPSDRALSDSLKDQGAPMPSQSDLQGSVQEDPTNPQLRAAFQPLRDDTDVHKEEAVAAKPQTSVPAASPLSHRRVASEGNAEQGTLTPRPTPPAKKKVLPVSSAATVKSEGKATRMVRRKPSGESHSRFRDGASAAANRRMALWGPSAPVQETAARPIVLEQTAISKTDDVDAKTEEAAISLARQVSTSSKSAADSAPESDKEASSDSDCKWEREEAAFRALQRRLEPLAVVDDDSTDDEAANQNTAQRPGWFRSNSMDLAKPGSSVPRAPPPLVLGRSRGGGAEYSSSSESSSESGANRMDDDSDDSLSPVEVEEFSSQGRPSFSTSDRPSVKGKEPMRPSFDEADQIVPSALPPVITRAGQFEEDSGSSHDFASDEGEQGHAEERRSDGIIRPPVGNRLKTLFSMPLGSNSSQVPALGPSAANRASAASLFDKQLGGAPSQASRESTQSVNEAMSTPILTRQPSDKSLRAKEWANAYATLEAKQQQSLSSEEQTRLEALEQISRLQSTGGGSSEMTSSINHDSLDALERLLSRRSYVPSMPAIGQADEDRRATLRRSGAIIRPSVVAPFVNPRSSIAPRPLGRLPTITNATRHFPPSRQATEEPSPFPSPTVSSFTPRDRRSVMEPANWMTHIPEGDRQKLPEPLEPVKKNREINHNGPPPPLPMRSSANRVSAMVERFEGQSAEKSSVVLPPRSPNKEQSPMLISPAAGEIAREDSHRRRQPPPPPPPPLPSAHQRYSRPVSASISTISPSSSFLPSSSGQRESTSSASAKPFKPPFLQDHTSPHISSQSTFASTSLSQMPSLPLTLAIQPKGPPPIAPRTRARPLPIPPIFKPVAAPSTETLQPQSRDTSPEENEDDSDNDEDSASPPPERSSALSHPAGAAARGPGPVREASLGYTDLDLFASRLADEAPADGTNYEDLHLLAEFLGPAKSTGATAEEVEALSVGVIEVLRKRIVGKRANGKDKIKVSLQLMGVKVERCGVCLLQFREGNLACLFPCLHVLHEDCATKLLRNTKNCPVCRQSIN